MPLKPRSRVTRPDSKMLSDSLRVTPISSSSYTYPSFVPVRVMGNRKNYEEFKKVYESNIRQSASTQQSITASLESHSSINPVRSVFKQLQKIPADDIADYFKYTQKPNPPKPLKTVKLPAPKQGNQNAIIKLRTNTKPAKVLSPRIYKKPDEKRGSTHAFVEKLKSIEKSQEVDTTDLIAQTNNEIDIASTQLEQIQDLLKSKRSEQPTIEQKSAPQAVPETKWNTKRTTSSRNVGRHELEASFNNEKHKIVDALNILNSKLQKMQDKYFKRPRIRYRSVNEVSSKSNRAVQLIFRNKNFEDLTSAKGDKKLYHHQSSVETALQNKPNSTDLRGLVLSELKKDLTNNTQVFVASNTDFESTTSKPNSPSVNCKYQIAEENIRSVRAPEVYLTEQQGDGSNSLSKCDGPKEQNKGDTIFLRKLDERISKSDYLSRELNQNSRNGVKSNSVNDSTKHSLTRNALNQLTKLRGNNETNEYTRHVPDKRERERHLQDHINAALRNSLFTALENKQ